MSKITFHTYPGVGEQNSDAYHYSQSIRIGPTIRTSGQGGFDEDGKIIEPMREQIHAAFKNVEKALKGAGGKGWSQVIAVRTFHIDLDASFETVVEMFKEFMPGHRPIWVAVGVAKLGEGMHVEMEAEAHDEMTSLSMNGQK